MTAEERAGSLCVALDAALRTTNGDSAWFPMLRDAIRAAEQEASDEALERAAQACEAMGDHCGGDGEGCDVYLDAARVVRSLKSTPGSEGGGRGR